jgi:hypothetical protein
MDEVKPDPDFEARPLQFALDGMSEFRGAMAKWNT